MSSVFGKPLAVVIHSLPGPNTAQTAATSHDECPARIYLNAATNAHCNHTLLSNDLLRCQLSCAVRAQGSYLEIHEQEKINYSDIK